MKITNLQATRDGYGRGIIEAAKHDPDIVVLCADVTESTRNAEFKKLFPKRFVQLGVHEQLMVLTAAGLAAGGKIPFIASYAIFCPGRAWEQIRTNICLNDVNVKIIGSHAGLTVGPDGATHQALEDLAIMRCLPNMTVISPADALEAEKATLAIAQHQGPCYLRLAREPSPVFTTAKTPFKIGRANVLRRGRDVALIACGPLVWHALRAAEELTKQGIDATVINMHTVKPLDEAAVLKVAADCGAIVTVEEHQMAGGLGGAVAELLARTEPTPMEFVGANDRFGESGQPQELLERYGLGVKDITAAAKKVLKRKIINP